MIIRDADAGKDPGFRLGFFTTTPVALPCAISGVLLMALLSQVLLPEGGEKEGGEGGRIERSYTIDFEVAARHPSPHAANICARMITWANFRCKI